jgi:hypothetical protein
VSEKASEVNGFMAFRADLCGAVATSCRGLGELVSLLPRRVGAPIGP